MSKEVQFKAEAPVSRLTIRQVEAFQAVMLLGSMTRAADFLQISQPAVSRLMADLQAAVGFVLFRRTRHGMVPTVDAERFQREVQRVFSGLEELERQAMAIRDLEIGELKICTISLYGNGILPGIIARFLQQNPGLNVILEIDTHDRLIDWLNARRCEIGLVSLPAFSGNLVVHRLAAQPAVCVMPSSHPLATKPLIHPKDLEGVPFISFPRESATRFQVDTLFEREGIERVMKVEAGSHEAVCNFVAEGVGVAIISPFSPHLRDSPALTSRPFHPALVREVGLLTRDETQSLPGQRFVEFVMEHFRNSVDGR